MQTLLITGASRGIGLELVRQCLKNGDRALAACRNPDKAHELAKLASHGVLEIYPLDVADEASVAHFERTIGNTSIDVLVNNAGVMGGERQRLDDMDYAAWMDAFAVNTMAPFRLTVALRENLKRASRPRVITLSSQMGSLSRKSKGAFAYRSSKAAVNKVMQVLALELEPDGIIVCPVHPGWVRTEMGGSSADISVEQSAAGLMDLINSREMIHSGRFWTWEGKEHDW